jgi:hypothetical protein
MQNTLRKQFSLTLFFSFKESFFYSISIVFLNAYYYYYYLYPYILRSYESKNNLLLLYACSFLTKEKGLKQSLQIVGDMAHKPQQIVGDIIQYWV